MKKLALLIISLIVISCGPAMCWQISSYYINLNVQRDSSIMVTETIAADFGDEPHHGIYRDIPLSGQDRYGNNYRLRCEIISVTDAQGAELQKSTSFGGGKVYMKIGDPNTTVTGTHIYVIKYKVLRAVHFFSTHAEIYWNAIGAEWTVPILQAICTVTLPSDVAANQLRTAVYTGYYGSTASDAGIDLPNKHTARFWSRKPLNPGEEMTVVVGWPLGLVQQPGFLQEAKWFITDNGYFFLPPIFLLCLFALWWNAGRDPDTGKSEQVTYDPPDNLNPAELGTLIDEKVDMRDISASIIDLAVKGFIRIKATTEKTFLSTKTDYKLELIKPYKETVNDKNLTDFEMLLVISLFDGEDYCITSLLQNKFYTHLSALKSSLYSSMVSRGYFTHSPDSVRSSYVGWGIVLVFAGVFGVLFLSGLLQIPIGWGFAVSVCGIMLVLTSRAMPRKTRKGKDALLAVRGFEEYISRAEKGEIEFQERNNYFEKFLPYAMALGIASKWANAFEGLQTQPPSWYTGDGDVFRPSVFAYDLDLATRHWATSMASQPRSSGSGSGGFFSGGSGFSGGSSGGGCGGGGGGGW